MLGSRLPSYIGVFEWLAKSIPKGLSIRLRRAAPEDLWPPDAAGLEDLQRNVSQLPLEVSQVYSHIGGMRRSPRFPLYLMRPGEVAATVQEFRLAGQTLHDAGLASFGDGEHAILLFSDGNGNYLGLHLKAPFAPRGFILDHEEPNLEPRFKSLASMLDALAQSVDREECYFGDMPTDYPAIEPALVNADDRELSLQLLNQYYHDPHKYRADAHAAMQLSHPHDMETFANLLDSEDMWISEKMCRIVGLRRYRPAINRMVEVAIAKGGNRIIATIVALRGWPDEEALSALRVIKGRLGKAYDPYFPPSLRP
jgi:hypothetical protein